MIMEDPDQNIHLKNLSLQQSANEEEALNLLFLGDTNRMIAEVRMRAVVEKPHSHNMLTRLPFYSQNRQYSKCGTVPRVSGMKSAFFINTYKMHPEAYLKTMFLSQYNQTFSL